YELIEENTISNMSEHESINTTEDNIQQYLKKSKIKNTDSCIQKWVRILQDHYKKKNISYKIQTLVNKEQLELNYVNFLLILNNKIENIIKSNQLY
ncbi:23285_t:CDS:1, partial [Cetraspora pellucida]